MSNKDAQIELEALKQFLIGKRLIDVGGINAINRAIAVLQKAEPETGEWLWDSGNGEYFCSECHSVANVNTTTGEWMLTKFCADCGVRMEK